VLNSLSLTLFIAHPTSSFLSFYPAPVFSLLVPTSRSHYNFSFFCILSPQILRNFLCHPSLILLVVSGFFDSFPSFLLVCVFVPFSQLYIPPSSFCSRSFHFFTGIPVSLVVFLLRVLCLFFQYSVTILHSSLPSILSSNLAALFPAFTLSLFFLHFLYLFFFHHSIMLLNIIILLLKAPLLFLSPIPQAHPTTFIAFLTISLICALSVALSILLSIFLPFQLHSFSFSY
jgi:hypothetical protein